MDPDNEQRRYAKVRDLFDRAMDVPLPQRTEFIRQQSGEDLMVAREAISLVESAGQQSSLLDQSPLQIPLRSTPNAGARIGAYQILERIGEGGMGLVFRARRVDGAFQKDVAVKVLSDPLRSELSNLSFRTERDILARLEHPNIARILDGGSTPDGALYLVMELIEGIPIDEYTRSLPLRERLKMFLQVCEAVQYAHRSLVVHRDIKPSNVLVNHDGAVKLLDFGIAKVLLNDQPSVPVTIQIRATPQYASPEQLRGQPVTTSTDVYSLGVLLYGLLTGKKSPYRTNDGSIVEIIQAVCERDVAPPSKAVDAGVARVLAGDLDQIAMKAMAKKPVDRYSSVEQLHHDVARYLAGQPVLARGPALGYRAGKFLRRHSVTALAAVLVFVSLTAGIVAARWQAAAAERSRAAAEQSRLIAEAERQQAQASRAIAERERERAEDEKRQAIEQRTEANHQRRRAEEGFRDVRELATSILFDIHDSLRELAGASKVRKLTLERALTYLQRLERDSSGNPELESALAAAYLRAATLTGSSYEISTETNKAALPIFHKALQLSLKLQQRDPSNPKRRIQLAQIYYEYGNGQLTQNDLGGATQSFRRAAQLSEALPEEARYLALMRSYDGLCRAFVFGGKEKESREYCQLAVDSVAHIPENERNSPTVVHFRALAFGRLAGTLFSAGETSRGMMQLRQGIETLAPLAVAYPENSSYKRSLAAMRTQLMTNSYRLSARDRLAGYQEAISGLRATIAAEPNDSQTNLYLATCLRRHSELLADMGRGAEGEAEMREALAILQKQADRPQATTSEINDYADALLKCRFPALADTAKALRAAERLQQIDKNPNPAMLDTLAWAQYKNGQKAQALQTIRRAIALTPGTSPLRKELEASQQEFESEK